MIKNYIKTTIRNILRNKTQAFINIIGLSIGLASAILILLFVWYEFSYDKFHPNVENTYRVYSHQPGNPYMNSVDFNVTSALFVPTVKQGFPEIKYGCRIWLTSNIMTADDEYFEKETFYAVDPDFFKIFAIDLLKGSKENALNDRNSVVISERIANKYFQGLDPIGRQIKMDSNNLIVTAVFKELPQNTHLDFNILVPFEVTELYRPKSSLNTWEAESYKSYIQLNDGVSELEFEQKLVPFVKQCFDESTERRYLLQPITDIHLKGNLNFEISSNGDINSIIIFGAIALFILLIASFNYMNLSTAQSLRRAKEVGLRKVIGAKQSQLIKQFLSESAFLTFISLIIALVLIAVFIPNFSDYVNRELSLSHSGSSFFILILLVSLGVAFLSGSYPALYLSRFTPVKVLKGAIRGSKESTGLRNVLVVVQFIISASLIICTLVVVSQLNFIQNKDMGFKTENIISVPLNGLDGSYLKNEIKKHPGILDVTTSDFLPSKIRSQSSYDHPVTHTKNGVALYTVFVDDNFIDFYNITLLNGEGFSQDMGEGTVCMMNEEAIKKMGLDNPIGRNIRKNSNLLKIVGEVGNFHFAPLNQQIQPAILIYDSRNYSWQDRKLSVKLHPDKMEESIAFIEEQYNSLSNQHPFTYQFIEDAVDVSYAEEQRLATLFNFFTILAVFIASLGLFGLVTFVIEQRTKEIGIRKVMGASVSRIVSLLSGYFTRWILLANIIAWPVAWYFMDQWISKFEYRIKLDVWIFLSAFLITLLIAALTVGFKSVKAAMMNPVDSLKYE